MGLAICRRMVKRQGGDVTARSTPGRGTTFVVTLPAKQPGAAGGEYGVKEGQYAPAR